MSKDEEADDAGEEAAVTATSAAAAGTTAMAVAIHPPTPSSAPPDERKVINHLLFHKALIAEESGNQRINEYIEMVKASKEGDHLVIPDAFDRAIAIAFELVTREHLNPWDIDLLAFSRMYLERVREKRDLDLITAGRLVFMAWAVLKLQSDAAVTKAESVRQDQEDAETAWDSLPEGDWLVDDADYAYTTTVLQGQAPIDEKIRHKGDRKVTLFELVEAFEQAKREAEVRATLVAEREKAKAHWKLYSREDVKAKVHKEDLEKEIKVVWDRINRQNGGPIPFGTLHANTRDDLVRAFISVLFLAAGRRIALWQDNFPYGPIFLRNLERARAGCVTGAEQAAQAPVVHEGPIPAGGAKLPPPRRSRTPPRGRTPSKNGNDAIRSKTSADSEEVDLG